MVEVINKSNITIQKIEYNYDDTNPQYKGEAFIKDIKYSFEIKAKSGDFKKWDVS